jgi:hypothetical protein
MGIVKLGGITDWASAGGELIHHFLHAISRSAASLGSVANEILAKNFSVRALLNDVESFTFKLASKNSQQKPQGEKEYRKTPGWIKKYPKPRITF